MHLQRPRGCRAGASPNRAGESTAPKSGVADHELTLSALDVALGWRDPDAGLVHHSNRGAQYAASDYRKKLKARSIMVSMSRNGDCWDNAPMESVHGTLKVECVNDVHFETREQARHAIVEYIDFERWSEARPSITHQTGLREAFRSAS